MSKIFEPVQDDFESLNIEELLHLQNLFCCTFPKDYADFLLKYGRCMFIGDTNLKLPEGVELEVFTMFGVRGDAGNILEDLKLHSEYAEHGFVPIADDMFNNRYVLNINSGKIIFIDYSNEEASSVDVADSFTDFINMIEVMPDDEN